MDYVTTRKLYVKCKTSKKIFSEFSQKDNPTLLSLHPFPTQLTLWNLMNILYRDNGDSSSERDTSDSGNSECGSPSSRLTELCSRVLTEDGHLRLDGIIEQLPPATRPLSKWEDNLYNQGCKCAAKGLAHYNAKNVNAEYEFVAPLGSDAFYSRGSLYNHANFLAKEKGSSYAQLFFVEMETCFFDKDDPVNFCCIVEPRPHLLSDASTSGNRVVYHPLGYSCSLCSEV